MLDCREKNKYKSLSSYHTSRYCNQKYFKLLVCGGRKARTSMTYSNVSCIDVNKVEDVEAYPPMKTKRNILKVVYLKDDIYVFGGWNNNHDWIKSVDKYSLISKTWSQVAEITDDRQCFCVCAFIDRKFVLGGIFKGDITNSCLHFVTSDYNWKEVAKMNEARSSAV